MGLFDTVKTKANALAADAERAGKITAAQARTIVLQNEVRKSERELGHAAFDLIERGEVFHPELEDAAAALRATREALAEKEQEIAALRHDGDGPDHTAFVDVPMTPPKTAPAAPAAAVMDTSVAEAGATDTSAAEAAPSVAEEGGAELAAGTRKTKRAPAAKKAAASKTAPAKKTRQAAPKKAAAPGTPAPDADDPA